MFTCFIAALAIVVFEIGVCLLIATLSGFFFVVYLQIVLLAFVIQILDAMTELCFFVALLWLDRRQREVHLCFHFVT